MTIALTILAVLLATNMGATFWLASNLGKVESSIRDLPTREEVRTVIKEELSGR